MTTHDKMGIDASRRNPEAQPLGTSERARLEKFIDEIHYSARFVACLILVPTAESIH